MLSRLINFHEGATVGINADELLAVVAKDTSVFAIAASWWVYFDSMTEVMNLEISASRLLGAVLR